MTKPPSFLKLQNPIRSLAYRYTPPKKKTPLTIVYLYGFRSDMNGDKVLYLESLCKKEGLGFLAFDYSGHGNSSGKFEEGTISRWFLDSLDMIDHFVKTPVILVGSSMGGWLAHLVALQRPQIVKGLLGIASAPDFTDELMWKRFSYKQQTELINKGKTVIATEYNLKGWTITKKLIEDGRKHRLLGKTIKLNIPIRLLHGTKDANVPITYSYQLLDLHTTSNIAVTLIKSGDHRLSRKEDLIILGHTLQELIETYLLTKEE